MFTGGTSGVVVEGLGLIPTILGMGAIYLAVTIGMFFNPALRQMDAGKGASSHNR
jgi:hypothetical protein